MKKKIEPWRIVVGILSIIFIAYMWVKKDIATIYSTMPKEQIVPLVVTTIVVTLIKVVAIALIIFCIKWIINRIKGKDK